METACHLGLCIWFCISPDKILYPPSSFTLSLSARADSKQQRLHLLGIGTRLSTWLTRILPLNRPHSNYIVTTTILAGSTIHLCWYTPNTCVSCCIRVQVKFYSYLEDRANFVGLCSLDGNRQPSQVGYLTLVESRHNSILACTRFLSIMSPTWCQYRLTGWEKPVISDCKWEVTKLLPRVRVELTAFRLWDWRTAYCANEA